MKRLIKLAVAFLAVFPVVTALVPIDCSKFSGWQASDCSNIVSDGSLSAAQKQDLYLNLVSNQGELAPFGFIENWNKSLEWGTPPESAVKQGNGIIVDAWVKIVSIEKSYFDLNSNEWFGEPSGELIAAKGYSIQYPPAPLPLDCRTDFSHTVTESLLATLNGSQIGNTAISAYSTGLLGGAPMVFQAAYSVNAELKTEHFREQEHCNALTGCFSSCDYYGTDYTDFSVNPEDSFSVIAKTEKPSAKIFVDEGPGINTATIKLFSVEPLNGFELNIGKNKFEFSESIFDINASSDGVLFATKSFKESKKMNGFVGLGFAKENAERTIFLAYKNTGQCTYRIIADFFEIFEPCNEARLKPVNLFIDANLNGKDFESTALVTVTLSDDSNAPLFGKKIIFGENGKEAITNANGAVENIVKLGSTNGVITARFDGDEEFAPSKAVKRVALENEQSFETTKAVLVFFGAYYFIFLIAKKVVSGGL